MDFLFLFDVRKAVSEETKIISYIIGQETLFD